MPIPNHGFMSTKLLYSALLIHLLLATAAGQDSTSYVSQGSFDIIRLLNPWLSGSNPAGMAFNPELYPGEMKLDYYSEKGDYKQVQHGDKLNSYSFGTRSYSKIGNSLFYGCFNYNKSFEKGTDYTNINDPGRETPYLLTDSIGGDVYDRELFSIEGKMSTPLGHAIMLGLAGSLDVGLATQDRDPRPMNKVLKLSLSPGLVFSLPSIKIGVNLLYSYYNEDIEIDIIEANKEHDFFQMHGLGTYIFHEARSFNRLYKQNRIGTEGQLNYKHGNINNMSAIKLQYATETADDGRKAGNASWSYIKNDSRLDINSMEAFNTTTISKNSFIHYLDAGLKISGMLGTEIIQRLETSGTTGATNWVTYAEEEKFDASRLDASLAYSLIKMKDLYLRDYEVGFILNYNSYKQSYYIPDRKEGYANISASLDMGRSFYIGRQVLSISCGLKYKRNISASLDFAEDSFFYNELLLPDHIFTTAGYYAPSIDLGWETEINKIFSKYFFNTSIDLYLADNDRHRTIFSFSTGVIF